ncbi:MAG: sugar-binding transcriptional regulator [Fusobacteriales bacterium]|nr:sugar-binding transcriptional regulator [Fusobacteriales bacterium]
MKKITDELAMIYKTCKLYYEEGYTQTEIAEILGISRPTVARLLKGGKEQGIVKLELVNPFDNDYFDLAEKLEKRYELREVIIVPDENDEYIQKKEVAKAAAEYFDRVLEKDNIIGFSMGTTIKLVVDYVTKRQNLNLTFLPLIGGTGQIQQEIHPNDIVLDFVKKYGGEFKLLHAPAVVSKKEIKNEFLKEKNISDIISYGKKCDIAMVGIGTPLSQESTMMKTGYFNKTELEEFKQNNVVGDICLQFYNKSGENYNFEFNERVIGIELNDLKRIRTVIGAAAGVEKTDAVIGALNGKFLDVLVTNYSIAKEIENYIEKGE